MIKKISKIISHPVTKLIFSIAIIGSCAGSIYNDFIEGFGAVGPHHGTGLVGLMMFLENSIRILDVWASD